MLSASISTARSKPTILTAAANYYILHVTFCSIMYSLHIQSIRIIDRGTLYNVLNALRVTPDVK